MVWTAKCAQRVLRVSGLRSQVQIGGKTRGVLTLGGDAAGDQHSVEQAVRSDPKLAKWLHKDGGEGRVVFVPGKVINFVPAKANTKKK